MLSLKELLSSNPPPSAALLAEKSYGWSQFSFPLFLFPLCQDFAWSQLPLSISCHQQIKATRAWVAKLTCRNTDIKLFRAQNYPGLCRNVRVILLLLNIRAVLCTPNSSCSRVQESVNNLSMSVWGRERQKERRNTNSDKLPCIVLGASLNRTPDYQCGWILNQERTCLHRGRN